MAENKLKFELGKYYEHSTGDKLYICGTCATRTYGMGLVGEDCNGNLIPIGTHKGATDNYHEISEGDFYGKE